MTPKERNIIEQRIIVLKQRIKWSQEELEELLKLVEEEREKK